VIFVSNFVLCLASIGLIWYCTSRLFRKGQCSCSVGYINSYIPQTCRCSCTSNKTVV